MARRNKMQILIDKYVNETLQKANGEIISILNEVNNELYDESVKMFDSLIDQFYMYKTTSYIRHGQSRPGTQMGENLYRANNIKKTYGLNPSLTIKLDGNDMYGGYKFHDANAVFDWVSSGVRFPFYSNNSNISNGYSANHLSYNGKYFSYKGSINSIFKYFDEDFDNISFYLFYRKWKKSIWCN